MGLSGATLFLAAYHRYTTSPSFATTIFGLQPSTQLALSGFLVLAGIPFTFLFVFPVSVNKLKARVATIDQGKGSEMTARETAAVREELKTFGSRNSMRACIWAAAFVLGLTVDV